ncbi:phage tail protein [uncultured Dysosmobacter sp.]|uniref:phage tail sheath family protein n=1 Tax=uncultured Dysosmobacter sp. TaxID=2591384 RepID=UPI00261C504E|nr:phage tail protein [uncultured Dysosmobacter sp.]
MAEYYHGVSTRQVDTSVSTPVEADCGVPFVVGVAPVHTVEDGKTNEPIMCMSYAEAVSALGYSDDWQKYPICEMIYSQFQLYGVAPVVFVNVLDPTKHKETVAETKYPVADGQVLLPFEAIKTSVKVKNEDEGTSEKKPYFVAGEDYDTLYDGKNLIVEILEGGGIKAETGELTIGFDKVKPDGVEKGDIIGGFDPETKKYSGFELIDKVFPKYGIVVDLLLAPGWSHDSEVAAIMSAKAASINGVFEGKALCDIDTGEVKHYADAPAWKKGKNINAKTQILCWPLFKLGDRVFHASVAAAGRMGLTDSDNGGCPAESPSNKLLQMDSAVLADGTVVLLDLDQANYLNSNGIVTALNFIGGYVLWGDETACFPADTDVKNYFISVSRTFGWVANSLVLTYWSKVDRKMTRRLIDSIVDSVNIWLNGLVSEEQLLGGRVEFREDENTETALMAGKAVFHVFITPPSPMKECEFVLEYDVEYVSAALTA